MISSASGMYQILLTLTSIILLASCAPISKYKKKQLYFPNHNENYEKTLFWVVKLQNPRFSGEVNLTILAHTLTNDLGLQFLDFLNCLGVFLLSYKFNDIAWNNTYTNLGSLHFMHKQILPDDVLFEKLIQKVENNLDNHPLVEWHTSQKIRSRQKRNVNIQDPEYARQWHLKNNVERKMDIDVERVWNNNITGRGITVAIVDDGLEWTNPDIQDNYNAEGSYDLNSADSDPMPNDSKDGNHHGTRCAGVVAAVANNVCGVGVAYHAKVSGIRMLDGPVTDSLEASALNTKLQINDIFSCSWGPDDDGKTLDGPHYLAKSAMRYGIDFGRRGYGSIYVVASGNGGNVNDNCNYDGYANSLYTVTIGAVDETGIMPYYGEECASMLAVTFSGGGGYPNRYIVTTDWTKLRGTGCTYSHSGTSAAAPMAAGIIALMLEAQPCLTWRDVQYIIAMAALKIDVRAAQWQKNGAGLFHSHEHGFGLMKAWRMVTAAQVWENVPWMTSYLSPKQSVNAAIPKSPSKLVETFTVTSDAIEGYDLFIVEHAQVTVTITHPYRGYLRILLLCPSGTESIIGAPRRLDNSTAGFKEWTFATVRCWGETPIGDWSLLVMDTGQDDLETGTLTSWTLKLYGTSMHPEEFQARGRLLKEAMNGEFLTSNETIPCRPPPVNAKPDKLMSQLLLLVTLAYAFCYNEERREHNRLMKLDARSRRLASADTESCNSEDRTHLLGGEERSIETIPMQTFTRLNSNVNETCNDDIPQEVLNTLSAEEVELNLNYDRNRELLNYKGQGGDSDIGVLETDKIMGAQENMVESDGDEVYSSRQLSAEKCGLHDLPSDRLVHRLRDESVSSEEILILENN